MEVILFIGLQGAGKTTFYRTRFAETHRHISKDNFRHNKNPERRQQTLLKEALSHGESVVIDNTNVTRASRATILEIAKQSGVETVGYYFAAHLKDCLERNRQRQGKECVPDIALLVTIKRLEPPTFEEGFDHLYHVETLDDGKFLIRPVSQGTNFEPTPVDEAVLREQL